MSPSVAGLRQARVAAFAADHQAFLHQDGARAPGGVRALRLAGMAHFIAEGLPTQRDEDWRWTDLQPVIGRSFRRPRPAAGAPRPDTDPWRLSQAHLMVLVDGRYDPGLSSVGQLPPGVRLMSLAQALDHNPAEVLRHLGQLAAAQGAPFVALANAFLEDGAYMCVPAGVVLERPVQVLALGTTGLGAGTAGNGAAAVRYPRVLAVLEAGAEATLVESYAPGSPGGLTCAVTELVLGAGAELHHCCLQDEHQSAVFMGATYARQERGSRLRSQFFSLGGCLSRSEVHTLLAGEGAAATLAGLYLGRGSQHMGVQVRVDHAAPQCLSRQLFKAILDQGAHAVFNGRIHVRRGAERTDASQSNRNLLLSRDAQVHSVPQLEILADDVRCTHGCTVGQLDAEALFYLRTRGIDQAAARSMLVRAFAADVLEAAAAPAVRERVERRLHAMLGAPDPGADGAAHG